MKTNKILLSLIISFSLVYSCKKTKTNTKIISRTEGSINVSVDESFAPIIKEQAIAFMNKYPKAKINLLNKAEDKCWEDIDNKNVDLIITTKKLINKEVKYYKNKFQYYFPEDLIAYDAMVLIVNKASPDSLMTEEDVKQLILGEKYKNKKIVVDGNTATSSVRYIMDSIIKNNKFPNTIHGLKNNEEVIQYVTQNLNTIGFIGYSWIGDPDNLAHVQALKGVAMVKIENRRQKGEYVLPNYGNIAKGRYPYYRGITYLLKQNYEGLASSFKDYMQHERGQLIFKRAGFLPGKMNFNIRVMRIKEME